MNTGCACGCKKTTSELRREYPLSLTIKLANPYNLPVGKDFPYARRATLECEVPPCEYEVLSTWPEFFHGSHYWLRGSEVEVQVQG